MKNVYLLKYYYHQYDQLDGYVKAVFLERPDFDKLKMVVEKIGDRPVEKGLSLDQCIEKLIKGEYVCENGKLGGGDEWFLEESECY